MSPTQSLAASVRVVREHWVSVLVFLLSAAVYATDIKRDHLAIKAVVCLDHPTDSLCR